jgi:hypothetical protein
MPNTWNTIYSTTLGSTQSSIDITSIPSTYTDLVAVIFARGTRGAVDAEVLFTFNGDSGANYEIGRGLGASGTFFNNLYTGQSNISVGGTMANSAAANSYTPIELHINNYATTGKFRTIFAHNTEAGADLLTAGWRYGCWKNTADAINRITFTSELGSYAAGTVLTLYGLAAA